MMQKELLKFLDKNLGTLACRLLLPPGARQSSPSLDFKKILFIRPGGIGDAALLLPSINEIKRKYAHAGVDILAEKRNSAIFSLCPAVHSVYHYHKAADLGSLLTNRYDLVIDTEQWHRLSAVIARLTRAPMLIGYDTNERKKLFTHSIPYSHDEYEISAFLNLLKPLSIHAETEKKLEKPFLSVSLQLSQRAEFVLNPLKNRRIVAIFAGSSIQERKWGSDRFRLTAKMLSERGYGIVVVGGREDVSAGEDIIRGVPNSLNFAGRLPLPETAAVLKESSLLITGDSGIMHIGFGLGTSIVALFGPGREKKWAPRGKNCIVINKNLDCSPCTTFGYTPRCSKNAVCMSFISVEEVFNAATSLLNERHSA